MLYTRKKVEILVYPKIFNVLAFYSKGLYTTQISIVQQSADGSLVYAMPKIIHHPDYKTGESKKAHLNINKQKKEVSYVTEQFYITFNQECVALHSMALFSLEVDPNSQPKTYIEFKLMLNRYKVLEETATGNATPNKESAVGVKKKVTMEVDKRKVLINDLFTLDEYKRITFAECEYFSFLDCYVGSCFLGTRFRSNQYQYSQFYCFGDKKKIDKHLECSMKKNNIQSNSDKGGIIAKQVNLSPQNFKAKYISELSSSYENLKRKVVDLMKLYEQQNIYLEGRKKVEEMLESTAQIDSSFRSNEQLMNQFGSSDLNLLYYEIYLQVSEFDNYIRYLWTVYRQFLQSISYKLFSILIQKMLARENISKQLTLVMSPQIILDNRRQEHQNFLKRRKQIIKGMKLYDEEDGRHPFLMVENYEKVKIVEERQEEELNSLVVFVHGYQGSDYDLEKAKNFLSIYNSKCYGLLIKSIQLQIDENIQHLGDRVAQEIKSHISASINAYKSISLIGYSLGGVIARESLKHLEEFKDKMNLLVTFASPHLGISISDNRLVGTGVWYLINFEKVKNMKQLNCQKTQNSQSEQITLKRLSESNSLSWFKKLILVSSQQDNFVPHHSSRISQNIKDKSISQMAKNIKSRVNRMERVEVWFDVEHDIKTMDKILGRRSHIQFLENNTFLDMFFRLYGPQF